MNMQLTVVVGADWTLPPCRSRSKAVANDYRHMYTGVDFET